MPPPFFSDEKIKNMCPQNHPPPLKKIYNLAPRNDPKYLNILPGIKPAPYNVVSPTILNNMAVSLIKDRSDNIRSLINAQEEVINFYEKPKNELALKLVQEAEVIPNGNIYNLRGSGNLNMELAQ